jgi:hypothetical protein
MLDIKIPIGFMFSIFGLLLTIYGIVTYSNIEMYKKSFEINVNLWSGIGMLIFVGLMILLSRKKIKKLE